MELPVKQGRTAAMSAGALQGRDNGVWTRPIRAENWEPFRHPKQGPYYEVRIKGEKVAVRRPNRYGRPLRKVSRVGKPRTMNKCGHRRNPGK